MGHQARAWVGCKPPMIRDDPILFPSKYINTRTCISENHNKCAMCILGIRRKSYTLKTYDIICTIYYILWWIYVYDICPRSRPLIRDVPVPMLRQLLHTANSVLTVKSVSRCYSLDSGEVNHGIDGWFDMIWLWNQCHELWDQSMIKINHGFFNRIKYSWVIPWRWSTCHTCHQLWDQDHKSWH